MPQRVIEKIRDAIRKGNYDMTMHAYEEMAEDNLTIIDVENAVLSGIVKETQKGDPRGSGRSELKCMDIVVNTARAPLESGS